MLFKVEVELDNIFENEGDLTEAILQRLTSQLAKIDIKGKIETRINEEIANKISKRIDAELKNITDDILNKEIVVTDDWGKVKSQGTMRDIVTGRFELYLKEKVSKDGGTSAYDKPYTRAEWFAKSIMEKEMDAFAKTTVETIKKAVKEKLSEDLRLAVGSEIVNSIGVKNVLDRLQLPEKK